MAAALVDAALVDAPLAAAVALVDGCAAVRELRRRRIRQHQLNEPLAPASNQWGTTALVSAAGEPRLII